MKRFVDFFVRRWVLALSALNFLLLFAVIGYTSGSDLFYGGTATAVGDTTTFTGATNRTLEVTFTVSLTVALLILLFVRRLGTAFALVLAVPAAVIGAFVIVTLLGFTFSVASLLAMTVAISLVVGDGVVVAENVDRLREGGFWGEDARGERAPKVKMLILAVTLSLLVIFIPVSFSPGVVGQVFVQFGLIGAGIVTIFHLSILFFLTARPARTSLRLPTWFEFGRTLLRLKGDFLWYVSQYKKPWLYLAGMSTSAVLYAARGDLRLAAAGAAFWLLPRFIPLSLYLGRATLYFFGALARSLFEVGDRVDAWLCSAYANSLERALCVPWLALLTASGLFASPFYLTETSSSLVTISGTVILMGLVAKNAILLSVLLGRLESDSSASLRNALLEAAGLRFRPVMTISTLTAISVLLLLGSVEGSGFRAPVGLVILSGAVCSVLLTFYVVPAALYQLRRGR